MEQNQFEGLEEVEMAEVKNEEEVSNLKEYEKLLLAERDREDYDKALTLIKFGCFSQKEETTVDYTKLEKVSSKKYKGLYTLYRDLEKMQLLFIAELVENNKGDEDERKDLKPYAYDVIYLEAMDEETYKAVVHAGRNNVSTYISKLVIVADIAEILITVLAVIALIGSAIVGSSSYSGFSLVVYMLINSATFLVGAALGAALLVLMHIRFNKYKAQQ
ncbi:MAG: hypothetical protein IJM36_05900 [Acholeplasmatales bacterium]|nr:hypothetical protein [Acholeplasmatales bacterium]